jgi:hypothetical protein
VNERLIDHYLDQGRKAVQGWVSQDDMKLFRVLALFQHANAISGHVCEIGVYAGKRFILFALCRRKDERAVAVDLFGDEAAREGGRDPEATFRENLSAHGVEPSGVRILKRDSAALSPDELVREAGGRIRIFSVDGAHTRDMTINDLSLACETLADGGLIVLDDYFNERWPGVSEGALTYLTGREGRFT